MLTSIATIYRWLMVVTVCGAVGAVANLVLFFLAAFLFADTEGDAWVRWYFDGDGLRFVAVTVGLAAAAFPFVKRLRLSWSCV